MALFVMIIVWIIQQNSHEVITNHQHQHAVENKQTHREVKDNRNVGIHDVVNNQIKIQKLKVNTNLSKNIYYTSDVKEHKQQMQMN